MLVLHSHLPFVKHPEFDYFLEEQWLFEAINECYIPLLMVLKRLDDEGASFKLTTSMTPPLCEMLSDPELMNKYEKHLDKQIVLAQREIKRTKNDPTFSQIAKFYLDNFESIKDFFYNFLNKNILNGYKHFKDKNKLEIITCAATHGFLPLMEVNTTAVKAQINIAVNNYIKHFGAFFRRS